jgi:hypothetical protein
LKSGGDACGAPSPIRAQSAKRKRAKHESAALQSELLLPLPPPPHAVDRTPLRASTFSPFHLLAGPTLPSALSLLSRAESGDRVVCDRMRGVLVPKREKKKGERTTRGMEVEERSTATTTTLAAAAAAIECLLSPPFYLLSSSASNVSCFLLAQKSLDDDPLDRNCSVLGMQKKLQSSAPAGLEKGK